MKILFSFTIIFFFLACNSNIPAKKSREKLLKYREDGYTVKLNDSLIRIDQLILDENKIQEILIDKFERVIIIKYPKKELNLAPLYWVVKSSEKDKLLVIDSVPIKHDELDSLKIELSAFRSVSVNNNSSYLGKKYKEVIFLGTRSNDR